jgi:hypothetical protein
MKDWAAAYGNSIFTFFAVVRSGNFWGMPPKALFEISPLDRDCCGRNDMAVPDARLGAGELYEK